MSHGPGLFHVYFVGAGDTNSNYTQNSPLYLVTFSSRTEADVWWMTIIQSSHDRSKLRRFNPQLIMAPLPNVQEWKCVIQTLKDNFSATKIFAAPPDHRTDYINGLTCFIRRAFDPKQHVYDYGSYGITYGSNSSTKFRIRRATSLNYQPSRAEEDILIPEDYVNIFPVGPSYHNQVLRWVESDPLTYLLKLGPYTEDTSSPTSVNERFKFSFFNDGRPNDSERSWCNGERWLLVN